MVGDFVATQRQMKATMKQKHWLGRINLAERLRFAGKSLGATVSMTAGHWYISIHVEVQHTKQENTNPIVGIDVGIKEVAIVSDGRRFDNHKPLTTQIKTDSSGQSDDVNCGFFVTSFRSPTLPDSAGPLLLVKSRANA